FQRLAESSALWKAATGTGYEDMLTQNQWVTLKRYFQQRHLVAHKDGFVDESYVIKANDPTRKPGQRLALFPGDVLHLTELLDILQVKIRTTVLSQESTAASHSENDNEPGDESGP